MVGGNQCTTRRLAWSASKEGGHRATCPRALAGAQSCRHCLPNAGRPAQNLPHVVDYLGNYLESHDKRLLASVLNDTALLKNAYAFTCLTQVWKCSAAVPA